MTNTKGTNMKDLVTRDSLQALLNTDRAGEVVGRALRAIFLANQTVDERSNNDTKNDNGIGFSGADARSGSITAKYFIKHGKLLEFQITAWTKVQRNGYAKLTKYAKQLNAIAIKKALAKQ